MKIVRLTAENIKRLVAVTIEPNGSVIKVGGDNGAGKSSLLDSIEYAIGGTRGIPAVPIRTGETKARVVLDLDADGEFPALHIERRFSVKGGSDLVVTSGGKRLGSPQAILDALNGRVGFDPLAFSRATPAEQRKILQGLVGLDFTELDKRHALIFDSRTSANRTVKELTAQATGMETFDDAPAEETSASALIDEIRTVDAANLANAEQRRTLESLDRCIGDDKDIIAEMTERLDGDRLEQAQHIAALDKQISEARATLVTMTDEHKQKLDDKTLAMLSHKAHYDSKKDSVAKLTDQPTDALQEQLGKCEETNRQVRANATAKELAGKLTARRELVDKLTGQLESIDKEKQAAMESAKWPVEGLGFSDDGVTFNGLPFEQASQAQSIDVSVAMGFAANPTLRVMLIRDASLLDGDSLARIAKLAEKHDGQVWLERVGEGDCSVVIRDGEVYVPPGFDDDLADAMQEIEGPVTE